MIEEAVKNISTSIVNNYYTTNNNTYTTNKTENITNNTNITNVVNSKSLVTSPEIRGCSNSTQLNNCYPLILGKTYFAPKFIGQPYMTPADSYGKRKTYHALYLVGYNDVNVTDISLGLKKLATNTAKVRSGNIAIDGEFDQSKYNIKLEIQNEKEVSLYPQKVAQQEINSELLFPESTTEAPVTEGLKLYEFSSTYPQKIELEFKLEGLVGKKDDKEAEGELKVKVEYSLDGGKTYLPFGKIGNVEGISYEETTGITTFKMKNYNVMYFVASKSFSWNEVGNATNNVIEFRIQRLTQHKEDSFIYDTISLAYIRTWCYDPEKSNSTKGLVAQVPMVEKDRTRTTRIALEITVDDYMYDLKQFNLNAQALGRTCTYNATTKQYEWSTAKTETCNPASMALMVMQSTMLGSYVYSDNDIHLQSYGKLYVFCRNYNIKNASGKQVGIECNGVVTKQTKLSDLLRDILMVGRATRIMYGNKEGVFVDTAIENTTLILNNQNVLDATNVKNFDELPSGLKIKFINEDNYSQEDEMYIDYSDAPASSDQNYKSLEREYKYQTNVEQIQKYAFYELAKLKLRPETWERKVGVEGNLAEIGSLIEVQDDTIAVGIGEGAEIIGITFDNETNPQYITQLITDGRFDVTDIKQTYGIRIQQSDGVHSLAFVKKEVKIESAGIYSTFTLKEPISLNETVVPTVGDILSFGVFSRICIPSICMGKQDNGDGTFNLSLLPYDANIYNADSGTMPEFHSLVTPPSEYRAPSYQKQPSFQDLNNATNEIKYGNENTKPSTPAYLSAIAYKDTIEIQCTKTGNELKDSVKLFEWEIKKGETSTVYKSANNIFSYIFDRTTDGYLDYTTLDTWTIRVRVQNIYDIYSEWTDYENISYFCKKSDYTWTPSKPVISTCIADKEGLKIEWSLSSSSLGTDRYKVYIYKGEELSYTSLFTNELTYRYLFDRTKDGYPEKSDLAGYSVKVYHANETTLVGTSSDVTSINVQKYGTWHIPALSVNNVSKEVLDRTCVLTLSVSKPSVELYGTAQFKISIKRYGIDGTGATLPVIEKDTQWYKPDLYSNPLLLESSYRTDEVDGYELSNGNYSQTLPLAGQSTNNSANTIYTYKISAINESGYETNAIEVSVTALCTSLRDIVKANAKYKNLYVERLSSICADLGIISQGGMGDFSSMYNYWALTDLTNEDTGHGDIKKGSFRVGDEDSYIQVSYDNNGKAIVSFRTSFFTVTATTTEFSKEVIIQEDNNSLDRTKITTSGTFYQHRNTPTSSWYNINKMDTAGVLSSIFKSDKQMLIGNSSQTTQRRLKHDIGRSYLSNNAKVWHFDDNEYSQNNSYDGLTIEGSDRSLKGADDSIIDTRNVRKIDYTPAILSEAPYCTNAKSLCGHYSMSYTIEDMTNCIIDFWIQYRYNESQELFDIGTSADKVSLTVKPAEPVAVVSGVSTWKYASTRIYTSYKTRNPKEGDYVYTSKAMAELGEKTEIRITESIIDEVGVVTGIKITGDSNIYSFEEGEPDLNWETFAPSEMWETESVIVNKAVGGDTEVVHYNQTKSETKSFQLDWGGKQFIDGQWYHIGLCFSNSNIKFMLDDDSFQFNRYSTTILPCDVSLNSMKTEILIDELYIDKVIETLVDFSQNTYYRFPWGSLSSDDNWFIFDAEDVTKVKSNILDYFKTQLLSSDEFKNAVRNV